MVAQSPLAHARLIFDNEFLIEYAGTGSTWIIDSQDDATGDIELQFGNDGTDGSIAWDITNNEFDIGSDFNLQQNQALNLVIDNRAGVAPATPVGGQIYHDTVSGNTFVRNGVSGQWEDVTDVNASQTKVVTVGTGLDYTTISAAATYLNGLSGGIMLLAAESHAVTTAVDLTNVTLIGKDADVTTIAISGSGQLDSFDTTFRNLTIDVNAITDDMAIDAQTGASSLFFEWVDFDVQDSGDSLIDSNAGAAPTVTVKIVNSEQVGTSGTILKTVASGNLNASSTVFISSASGNSLLEVSDWDVTVAGFGNVNTSGAITAIPNDTIVVYPGMNLQGAIDSITTGGSITLLPGTHSISSTLTIDNDDIEIVGYGDSSIISASGFSGITGTTAAIQVGAEDGSAAVDGTILRNFRLNVDTNNIHGVRISGGDDNQVDNVTVVKTAGTATTKSGIVILNSDAAQLVRPVVKDSRVSGTSGGGAYFTDGIELQLDNSTFGGTRGIVNALIDGNEVDYVGEDAFSVTGLENSSIYNNVATQMGQDGVATDSYGYYLEATNNINMNANLATGPARTDAIGIGIEPVNTGSLNETLDSIFAGNIIDGEENSGVGFQHGFMIGDTTNTGVHRNSFQNNSILGASATTTVAINIRGNADQNSFVGNNLSGGTNAWDTGISLASATQENNLVRGNRTNNVTTYSSDSSTALLRGVPQHQATADPTINDDVNDGYRIGTIWINTTSDETFVLVDETVGAAVWDNIADAGSAITGVNSNTFTLDQDDTGGDVTLQFGTSLAETLTWDNTNSEFDLSDDLNITGGLITSGNIDLNSNELIEARIENLGSAPTCNGANAGRLYHDTGDTFSYVCNGTGWQRIDNQPTTAVFDGYDNAGNTSVTTTEATLNIDSTNVSDANYTLASDVVTINTTGLYLVTARLTVDSNGTTGATRSSIQLRAEEDTGGGFTDIPGVICQDYMREQATGISSASCTVSFIRSFNATDDIQLTHQMNGTTTGQTVPQGSGLTIEFIR